MNDITTTKSAQLYEDLVRQVTRAQEIIYKYDLSAGPCRHAVKMPQHAQVLTAQLQRGIIRLWVRCNPMWPDEKRYFEVHPTGLDITPRGGQLNYISTVQDEDGLVWHVFENANIDS